MLDVDANVRPNIEGIQNINEDVQGIFNDKHEYLAQLADTVNNDYDSFLDSLQHGTTLVAEVSPELSYEANLFHVNDLVKETLDTQEHPMRTYLELQKEQVEGFENALENNTPKALNMTDKTHEKIKGHARYLKSGIDVLIDVLDEEVDSFGELQTELTAAEAEKYKRDPVTKNNSYFEAAA